MMGGDSIKVYRENLDISVEQWLGLLKDNVVFKNDDIALMRALYNCRGCREKASVLAAILGVSGHSVLNLQIGRLGKRIVNRLPDVRFPSRDNGSIRYWHIPFWAEDAEKKGQFIWELRPELKEAIKQLFFTSKAILMDSEVNGMIAEEISEEESKSLFEGAKKQITVNAYERNSQARKACMKYYGASCQICGFNFGKFYGSQFEGIIHVHHIKPISELKDNYQVNPKEDLIPVCPNCHFAIHSRTPPYSLKELKSIIK
jgi:5-methylcytosine-specific restriction protein A